jgi:hypothetical protein
MHTLRNLGVYLERLTEQARCKQTLTAYTENEMKVERTDSTPNAGKSKSLSYIKLVERTNIHTIQLGKYMGHYNWTNWTYGTNKETKKQRNKQRSKQRNKEAKKQTKHQTRNLLHDGG